MAAGPLTDGAQAPPTRSPKRRTIFVVANNIEELGGLQRVAHLLAGQFAQRGNDVTLIGITHAPTSHERALAGEGYRTLVVYDDRPARSGGGTRRGSRLRRLKAVQRLRRRREEKWFDEGVRRLKAVFDSVDSGVVLCTQVWAMRWVQPAAGRHLRVIGQSHESFEASAGLTPATLGSTRYARILELYPDIDAFLLLTEEDAVKFRRVGLNNTGVMHNPITMYPATVSPLTEKTVISVGRYAEQKNQRALIDAFAQVAQRHPDWQLKIFGEGPLRTELEAQIAALGLHDRALLMGPSDRVEEELLRSSVFALSSDFEGLPLVLAEAMACGVPCVAFDCSPGIREIVTDGVDGLVVEHRNVAQLADGIARLIEDEQLRSEMGARARENIRRFDMATVMKQWDDLLDLLER